MTTLTPQQIEELEQRPQAAMSEKVVNIRRVAKVVKGGRHLSFSVMVTVGDGQGHVGVGLGKAEAIPDAVRKGATNAQKDLITVALRGTSIPHVVRAKYGASMVLLKPAPVGTGIIAGASTRAVLELAGVKDVVAKSLGSQNPINVARAVLAALRQLSNASQERPVPEVGSIGAQEVSTS